MVFQNDILAGASGVASTYEIDQSIRFNDDDTAYLTRTQDTGDSKRIATFSWWMKRGSNFGTESAVIAAGASSRFLVRFNTSDQLTLRLTNGTTEYTLTTNMVFRDPSAWYHCVWRIDVTQATAADRSQLYVNGSAVTFTGSSLPAQNTDVVGLADATTQRIGILSHSTASSKYDGYLAEFYYMDGQALAPTDFGETNSNGVWVPKEYTGLYGTNSFYITGEDSSDLGADYSGNGNDFTSSGLTADDQRGDTPTENYATLNPLWKSGSITLSNGNLTQVGDASNRYAPLSMPIPSAGKFYFEVTYPVTGANVIIGIDSLYRNLSSGEIGADANGWSWRRYNGTKLHNASSTAYGSSSTGTGTVMVAIDADNGKIWFGEADVWNNSGDPAAGTNEAFSGIDFSGSDLFLMTACASFSTAQADWAITEDAWSYTPPTGFSALSTANLPAPTIADGSANFQTTLYTGNGTAIGSGGNAVTQSENSTFQPDFVWMKSRSAATDHALYDAVRGTTKEVGINVAIESTLTEGLTTFGAAGFTVGSDAAVNTNTATYAAWQWLANGSGSSNEDGATSSTVSANQTAGFSVVTYTGTGSATTIGHGLGAVPQFIAIKSRTYVESWGVYPGTSMGYGGQYRLKLNETSSVAASSGFWNNTDATSSVFSLGTELKVNKSGENHVAYCWAEIEGFSKFGSYTGNGSADGAFVWCGFRPAWIIIKCSSAAGESWHMFDTERDTYNVAEKYLYANAADAEATSSLRQLDFLSNGVKLRGTDGGMNRSGRTYIFMAFAENPFGGDGVAPATAR